MNRRKRRRGKRLILRTPGRKDWLPFGGWFAPPLKEIGSCSYFDVLDTVERARAARKTTQGRKSKEWLKRRIDHLARWAEWLRYLRRQGSRRPKSGWTAP